MRQLTRLLAAVRRWLASRTELMDQIRELEERISVLESESRIQAKELELMASMHQRHVARIEKEIQLWKPIIE